MGQYVNIIGAYIWASVCKYNRYNPFHSSDDTMITSKQYNCLGNAAPQNLLFTFDVCFYSQRGGVARDSYLSYANIFLCYHEMTSLKKKKITMAYR